MKYSLNKIACNLLTFSKNSNHHQNYQKPQQQQQSNQTRSGNTVHKSNKKSTKSKKSVAKVDSLNSSKDAAEKEQLPHPSTSKAYDNYNNKPKTTMKPITQTKVKSGSWKRSEKSLNPYNSTLTSNKKPKTLRKKSPTWLQFPNSKVKLQDLNTAPASNEQTSACRPGTLYSDVLFGAGCSNLVKIKNVTPRRSNCTAQKKLTKALQKFVPSERDTSDEDEIKTKRLSFPSLENVNSKIYSPTLTNSTICSDAAKTTNSLETISNQESSLTTDTTTTTSTPPSSPTKIKSYEEEADVVILSELNGASTSDKDVSYGHYLEQHCHHMENGKTEIATPSNHDKQFLVSSICDIPKWNFIDADIGSDAFPKFLCQFDDENYLKAEKMAWLGLKLALGNNSPPNIYKF